ncbi:MAG TPA: hypothetical protein IAA26_05410 [Candidatus Blautia faecipullorum]|nr:hypothetical protein [Candidatus Blautia faecipullorum]
MWGYVIADKMNMLIKDYYTYHNVYCSLCDAIGKRYGLFFRSMLSYDIAFLVICLDSIEQEEERREFRCPVNPFKKRVSSFSQRSLNYGAFINYYLVLKKLEDDIRDDNSKIKRIIYYVLKKNRKYQKDYLVYHEKLEKYEAYLRKLVKLEDESTGFDDLTNTFGNYFAGLFVAYLDIFEIGDSAFYNSFFLFAFNLGKWIYLMDAYEDFHKDIRRNKYNLISDMIKRDDSTNKIAVHKKIQGINGMLIYNMRKELDNIVFDKHRAIIENIIGYGCFLTYRKILENQYPEIRSEILKS